MAELARETVVLVTHGIDEALRPGDRIAVFGPGCRLARYDTPLEILSGDHVEITAYQLFHPWDEPGPGRRGREGGGAAPGAGLDAGQPDGPEPPAALEQLIAARTGEGLDAGRGE